MKGHFTYSIESRRLNHPMDGGRLRFAAKVGVLTESLGANATRRLVAPTGEFWGETRGEAEDRVEAMMKRWCADRGDKNPAIS